MNLKDKVKIKDATICIVGLGYVGLPTAIAFAKKGFKVIGADKKEDVVKSLNDGISHLKDLGLGADLRNMVKAGMFRATTDTTKATEESDVIIICVPTPVHPDKTPDLYPVTSAGEDIARGLSQDRKRLVILESTVYPGVTEEILAPILETSVWRGRLQAGMDFGLAHVPERYNPGDEEHGISDVVRVVGGITPDWTNITGELYQNIAKDVYKVPDIKTAEAAKIIENIQRDLNIALMNELALIFERMDIDINAVIGAAKTKWNFHTYYPGAGVGGHCLTKDGLYLASEAKKLGYYPQVILAGRAVNDSMPYHIFDLLQNALNEHKMPLKDSKIVVMGLSYKEDIGDIRESPSIVLINELKKWGAEITVIDPYVSYETLFKFGNPEDTIQKAVKGSDALVLMTAHRGFKDINYFPSIKDEMRTPIIIDGRCIFDQTMLETMGFTYKGVGVNHPRTKFGGMSREGHGQQVD